MSFPFVQNIDIIITFRFEQPRFGGTGYVGYIAYLSAYVKQKDLENITHIICCHDHPDFYACDHTGKYDPSEIAGHALYAVGKHIAEYIFGGVDIHWHQSPSI